MEKEKVEAGSKRIHGYDYRSWDKFDVVNYLQPKFFLIHECMQMCINKSTVMSALIIYCKRVFNI